MLIFCTDRIQLESTVTRW